MISIRSFSSPCHVTMFANRSALVGGKSVGLVIILGVQALFDPCDLTDAALMPATGLEVGVKPAFHNPANEVFAHHVARETQGICVVVMSCHLGSQFVVTKGGANSGNFVGTNGHSYSASTDKDGALRLVVRSLFGSQICTIRIITAS